MYSFLCIFEKISHLNYPEILSIYLTYMYIGKVKYIQFFNEDSPLTLKKNK